MGAEDRTYTLPTHDAEMERLNLQNRLWKLILGEMYGPAVKEALVEAIEGRQGKGEQSAVLDVGSGSGIWTAEMARAFPHTRYVGIDRAQDRISEKPSNLSFEVGDIFEKLEYHEGKYDVVHCRMVLIHVKEHKSLLDKMARCLRPGGLLILCECAGTSETRVLDEVSGEVWGLKYLMDSLSVFAEDNIHGEHLEMVINTNDHLQLQGVKSDWVNCNWADPDDENGKEVLGIMKKWHPESVKACMPLLRVRKGWTDEMANMCGEKVNEELATGQPRYSYKMVTAWATRK